MIPKTSMLSFSIKCKRSQEITIINNNPNKINKI
jgi:hypothetical protein